MASVQSPMAVSALAIVAWAALLLSSGSGNAAELIWTGDFETGDFSQYEDKLSGRDIRATKYLVTSPVRAGRYATELIILGLGSSGIERAELVSRLPGGGNFKFLWDGPEYWIGFSFLFKEWDANAHTFFQLHAPNEPKGAPCDYAGNTFSIWGDGEDQNGGIADRIAVRLIEKGGISDGEGAASNNEVVHTYPFPLNEWQDYVVNFRLSTKGDGFYHVWKNGKRIYSRTGLTNVNHKDSCGNPVPADKAKHNGVHIGIYAPGNPAYRRIFYDEVRVALGSDGFDLVAPGNGSRQAPTEQEPAPPKPPTLSADD
jgi:hypothetical protein